MVLDIGTGTGVLPRNMYEFGGKWIGTDISENQIEQAKILASEQNMDIEFYACPAKNIDYPDNTFDVIKQEEFFVKHYISAAELQVKKQK